MSPVGGIQTQVHLWLRPVLVPPPLAVAWSEQRHQGWSSGHARVSQPSSPNRGQQGKDGNSHPARQQRPQDCPHPSVGSHGAEVLPCTCHVPMS